MSRFKRYQSKVFWGQMEARDLGDVLAPRRQNEEEEVASAEENLDSDTTDAANITVIHVEEPQQRSLDQIPVAAGTEEDRAFSRASRGQRSQDSGFSDSGRSDSSGPDSPLRSRQQRRSSRRRAQHPRLAGLGAANGSQEEAASNAPLTSTPKHSARRDGQQQQQQQLRLGRHESESAERAASVASNHSGITLFSTSDPPIEDQFSSIPHSSSSCQEATSCRPSSVARGPDPRAPARAWLEELRTEAEDECTAMLQSKSLPQRRCRPSLLTAAMKLVDTADRFDQLYQRTLDSLGHSKHGRVEKRLVERIESEANELLRQLGGTAPRRISPQENLRSVSLQLARLKNKVDRALDSRLDSYVERLVADIESSSLDALGLDKGARAALLALGLTGPRAAASVARCSGVRALLLALVAADGPARHSEACSASLHALAAVCCCLEAIEQFVKEAGPEILTGLLLGRDVPPTVKFHAAALLVQITAPWMDRLGLPYVEEFGPRLVGALTELAEQNQCKDTLLLAAAALNNLAHSRRCIPEIVSCDSIRRLLRCLEQSSDDNVHLKEQIAGLIGQVGRLPQARAYLTEARAALLLVRYLRIQPDCEQQIQRLKATASEALARLCEHPEIAKQVLDSEAATGEDDSRREAKSPRTSTPKRREERLRQLHECFDELEKVEERASSAASQHSADTLFSASEPPEGDETTYLPLPSFVESSPRRHRPGEGLDVRAPVKLWLEELRHETEDECSAMLQSKALPRKRCKLSAVTAAMNLVDVARHFDQRCQQVLCSISASTSGIGDRELLELYESEAFEILLKLGPPPSQDLRCLAGSPPELALQVRRLRSAVDSALDRRLDLYSSQIVLALSHSPSGASASLLALGLSGARASASIARCSGIRALLAGLQPSSPLPKELRSASLHALAACCCCPEAVEQFVREGGPELLADVLGGEATPRILRFHAAALLVQITAPWLEHRLGLPCIEGFGPRLVRALTEMPESGDCKDSLLLAAAALKNLARSRSCVLQIVECGSIKRLLRCVKRSSIGNVCLIEQVASLIGQVARVPQARAHLAESHASVALVCFMRMQPPGLEDNYRRLEATASEALARLCRYPEIARQVVAVGGSDFLPHWVGLEKEDESPCPTRIRGDELRI